MTQRTEIRKKIILLLKEKIPDNEFFSKNCKKIDLRGLNVDKVSLNHINFINMFSNGCFYNQCHLYEIKFSHSDFRGVIFQNVAFNNVIFENSSIIGASFINCNFKNVKFYSCDLAGANFGDINKVKGIEFYSCNLYNVPFVKKGYFNKISGLNISDYYYNHILMFFIKRNMNKIPKLLYLICRVLFNSDIPLHSIELGKNCRFAHLGFSTLVVGNTKIGDNSWIGPNVNIFNRNDKGNLYIGKNVVIGIGSKISANIGDNVIVGAGALILDDIPNNAIIYGTKSEITANSNVNEK